MQLSRKKQEQARKKAEPKSVLQRQLLVGVGIVVVIGLLVTAVWYGTRIAALTIAEVSVSGGQTVSHEEIERLVNQELTGSYYRLIPKRFAWTYPKEVVTERVSNQPRVQEATVERNGKTVAVTFVEYTPGALFCRSLTSSDCLFLYQSGYAFANAPTLTGSALLRYVDDNQPFAPGMEMFPEEVMDRTSQFVAAASQLGFNVTAVKKTSQQELSYHIAGGGRIITSLLESYESTVENLATILQSEEFTHLEPGNFQYIDLRFGSKVFVNEELPELETATTTASMTQETGL